MTSSAILTIETGPEPGGLRVVGELDLAGAPQFRAAVRALGDVDIVVDLSQLRFVDARGLAEFVWLSRRQRARRRTLRLVGAQRTVLRVFRLAHVGHLLDQPG